MKANPYPEYARLREEMPVYRARVALWLPHIWVVTRYDDVVRILFPGSGELAAAVHGGFVQMTGDHLVVLSDVAELAEHIDVARAERARAAAEEALARDPDDEAAAAALRRAEVRLRVATGSAAAH